MGKLLCLVTSLLLLGCATPGLPTSYDVSVDSSFTADEVADIEEGFNSWSGYGTSAPTFQFTLVPQNQMPDREDVPWATILVKKVASSEIHQICHPQDLACTELRGTLDHIENGDANLFSGSTGAVTYMPPVSSAKTAQTYVTAAAHEAGHAMGMSHAGTDTVMYWAAGEGAPFPTCVDMQRYVALRPNLPVPAECSASH